MFTTHNSQVFLTVLSPEKKFHELLLGLDGRIYFSSSFEETADWSYVYYNGNCCVHHPKSMYCYGSLPKKCMELPTVIGETCFHNAEENSCLLRSTEAVLDDNTSVFVIFRYKDSLALYMADSMVSKGIYFALMDYTPEDEALYSNVFSGLLRRHNPAAEEALAAWLDSHTVTRKENEV